jgi:hypothetical protein
MVVLVQILHPPHKSECLPFWNGWRHGSESLVSRSPSMTWPHPTEFHKDRLISSKIIGGGGYRQNSDLISLTFLFKDNRLKTEHIKYCFRHFGIDMVCDVVVHSCRNTTSWSENHRCRTRIHKIVYWSISQPHQGGNVSLILNWL